MKQWSSSKRKISMRGKEYLFARNKKIKIQEPAGRIFPPGSYQVGWLVPAPW